MSEDSKSTNKKTLTQRLAEIGGIAATAIGTTAVSLFLYYRPDMPNYTPPHLLVDLACTIISLELCGVAGYEAGRSIGSHADYYYKREKQNE